MSIPIPNSLRPGYVAENNTIQLALVGCGGRGTGAVVNALSTQSGPIKLTAMAELFENRLTSSYAMLKNKFPNQVDVPRERQFVGFDAYKRALDCLSQDDVAIFATPAGFRWVHFAYAIRKGIHVFMEKPLSVDGPTSCRMLTLARESETKGLKVAVGLMCRHNPAMEELHERIQSGQIGEIIALRSYRLHGPEKTSEPKPSGIGELLYQVKQFHSFLWASGGLFNDFYIYNLDDCCWMKGAWPESAIGLGGRHYQDGFVDQNFDHYSVEYRFKNGSTLFFHGRFINRCHEEHASYAHGTKGMAIISSGGHNPAKCRLYKGHNPINDHLLWRCSPIQSNPYQRQWERLINSIREDQKMNEAGRGAEASLVATMGRMAAHTGQQITRDDILQCDHEFAPQIAKLTMESEAPLKPGQGGRYPVPQPGRYGKREY